MPASVSSVSPIVPQVPGLKPRAAEVVGRLHKKDLFRQGLPGGRDWRDGAAQRFHIPRNQGDARAPTGFSLIGPLHYAEVGAFTKGNPRQKSVYSKGG